MSILDEWTTRLQYEYTKTFEKELEKQLMESYTLQSLVPFRTGNSTSVSFEIKSRYVEDYIPKQVIFNNRTTVVIWKDNSKTVVRCAEGEKFVEEIGLAEAIVKKLYGGNRSKFLRLVEGAYRQPENKKK